MQTTVEIQELLEELNEGPGSSLEYQHLDFKEWKYKSFQTAVEAVIDVAIGMENGGGVTVACGANEKVAILNELLQSLLCGSAGQANSSMAQRRLFGHWMRH